MSQEGMLIITEPERLAGACAGWPRGLEEPRQVRGMNPFTGEELVYSSWTPVNPELSPGLSFETLMSSLEGLTPVSEEITLHSGIRFILDDAPVAFVAYDLDDLDDIEDEEERAEAMQLAYPIYHIRDGAADELLAEDPTWAKYANRELRKAAGLEVYFYLFSY